MNLVITLFNEGKDIDYWSPSSFHNGPPTIKVIKSIDSIHLKHDAGFNESTFHILTFKNLEMYYRRKIGMLQGLWVWKLKTRGLSDQTETVF